jgi:hypothetical protein
MRIRVALDRLVRGGYLVARPADVESVQYRITQRGKDAVVDMTCECVAPLPGANVFPVMHGFLVVRAISS